MGGRLRAFMVANPGLPRARFLLSPHCGSSDLAPGTEHEQQAQRARTTRAFAPGMAAHGLEYRTRFALF
jgi:hypothetical protein